MAMHATAQSSVPLRHADEFLDHWANAYVEHRVRDYGVKLEFFLAAPERILHWIEQGRISPIVPRDPTPRLPVFEEVCRV